MIQQSTHTVEDRGLDAYFTPREAVDSLLAVEHLPDIIWEPAAGNGAIALPLREAGHFVHCSDIADYGLPDCVREDYLTAGAPFGTLGIVTNPPFRLAADFVRKALGEVEYCAFLLRTNFLESVERLELFRRSPPSRVWVSSRRLPMMHRLGWEGPIAPSNTCFAWFIWDSSSDVGKLGWFDWMDYVKRKDWEI